MYFVGVDVGGTNLKIGLIENNRIIDKDSVPTNTFDIVTQITNLVIDICEKNNLEVTQLSGVGIGFPGLVINGKVVESANIGLSDCQLNELVADELGVPCVVRNDGEMATLAEHRLGAGRGTNNMLLLTIGTGIGGGIIINNQLYVGNGGAGELGHITLVNDGIPCGCGRRGCAEKYLSAVAVQTNAREYFREYPNSLLWNNKDDLTVADILVVAEKGDDCANEILSEYIEHFANYILGFCNIFRPEKILIGGGISHSPKIIERVAQKCKEKNFGYKGSPEVAIEIASLGNEAGILGTCVCYENALGIDLNNAGNVSAQEVSSVLESVRQESSVGSVPKTVDDDKEMLERPRFSDDESSEFYDEVQSVIDENGGVVNTIASDYGVEEADEDLPESESDSLLAGLYEKETEETQDTENTVSNDNVVLQTTSTEKDYVQTEQIQTGAEGQSNEMDPYDDNAEGMGNSATSDGMQEEKVMTVEEMFKIMDIESNNNE